MRLELVALRGDRIELEVCASKGYYVRALARDLGERLGVPACLSALRRTQSGGFTLEEAWPWPLPEHAVPLSLPVATRRCMPTLDLVPDGARRARLGQALSRADFTGEPPAAGAFAWLAEGELVAVGEQRDDAFRVLRGFGPR
jgi:tRNA pseudouridine55 synthase